MKCPFCGFDDSKVIDSRPLEDKKRRRRECQKCGRRFTTYEVVEIPLRIVVKRDGSFQPFDRNKLLSGIFHAIKKRPVTIEQVNSIADEIEDRYTSSFSSQMSSDKIGSLVMERLRELDAVAYIRFASVYQDFTDVAGFIAAISDLDGTTKS
ncbi:MAG: transcriptional repressor NrdR [Oscillospiraceae bacterium]|nr:transcriptional repressor NrdR [Ruminococcus sp.]MBQ7003514.1 transcriptional repressor NrdR [Oscillospiraceae bacterium]MBQ7013908.1 transcriptional repressor NrdR [Oscillospiraceae bacterium]